MAPIMEGVFGVALLANLEAFQKEQKYHIYGRVYHMVPLSGMQH
ncbi:MAG: hypothetical protein ACLS7Y_03675 [Thomasclavelia spiroformis]